MPFAFSFLPITEIVRGGISFDKGNSKERMTQEQREDKEIRNQRDEERSQEVRSNGKKVETCKFS